MIEGRGASENSVDISNTICICGANVAKGAICRLTRLQVQVEGKENIESVEAGEISAIHARWR
jgi:hypothetical protein